MKVVVTGASGRIGQAVVRELLDSSGGRTTHEVITFGRQAAPRLSGVHNLEGSVEDLGQMVGALAGADAVIHLAGIRFLGIATNEVTYRTNVMSTFNVHEAAWRVGIRKVISTSSTSILGWDGWQYEMPPEYLPVDEAHPTRPQDAYGLSKLTGEAIAQSYTDKCGMETVRLRPAWVTSDEELEALRRSGGRPAIRFYHYSYVHVDDLAAAYRLALELQLEGSQPLYVLADDSTASEPLSVVLPRWMPSVRSMAAALDGTQPAISNRRAKQILGWRPVRSWRATPTRP